MENGDFHSRKKQRAERYFKYEYKSKLKPCSACNGSGIYDNTGSPKCSWCGGTGKERRRDH